MPGQKRKIVVVGAAGRDFHNFNVRYRHDESCEVVAFTGAQIPGIEDRIYPSELAGPLYPDGIPIRPEDELEELVRDAEVDEVVFSYSDLSHEAVMHIASRALAAGADFTLLGPRSTALRSTLPVVAVTAVRTGSGKSQTTRAVARIVTGMGLRAAIVRHPMPYGELARQRVQRFETFDDLDAAGCTIEEREEYEPHLLAGSVVYAGVDYEEILRLAERDADVIVWDGGNNDLPFYVPTVHITVADPLRAGHETRYHPGEANLRMADVVVVNKVDSADRVVIERLRDSIEAANPSAVVVEARSPIVVDPQDALPGKRAVIVEDGPTITHGEMAYGAGFVAASRAGAEPVDPRPWAVGSIKTTFDVYPHITSVLPAMGYSPEQCRELTETLDAADADVVVIATPIDLRKVCPIAKPAVRVTYELDDAGPPTLAEVLAARLQAAR